MDTSKTMQQLLEQSHLTIQEMSDLLGVARNNFYLWKKGKSVPKRATVIKLSNILDIPLYDDSEYDSSDKNFTKKSMGNIPISTEKTIFSVRMNNNLFRFIDAGTNLLEVEAGYTENESVSYAVRKAIDQAILEMIKEGEKEGLWEFKLPNTSKGE